MASLLSGRNRDIVLFLLCFAAAFVTKFSATALIVASCQFVFYPLWRPARVHPHYLAYFNEIAGGPRNGCNTLVDSNLDWGQELKALRSWLAVRNITEPVWLSYFGMADPRWYQIPHISVPKVLGGYQLEASPYSALEDSGAADKAVRKFIDDVRAGQYLVISATNLSAVYLGPQTRDVWEHLLASCTYVGPSRLFFAHLSDRSRRTTSCGMIGWALSSYDGFISDQGS